MIKKIKQILLLTHYPIVTGFLLRSDVVSGWQGLLVDGYNEVVNNDQPVDDRQED
jgi:hypothetical protein